MKTLYLFAVILFSNLAFLPSFAQNTVKKETIQVWGNCGMCKTNIEKAAKKAGATLADWNEDSKELKITYATNKTSSAKIQSAIAQTGYDTRDFTGDNAAYSKLHACCQYERKAAISTPVVKCCDKENCGKDETACKDAACCKEQTCCKS